MRRLLVLLLLTACATLPPSHDAFQVMTYNIRLNLVSDGPDAWPHRKEAVADLIARTDIAGVQEALPEQLGDLDRLLPQYGRFGAGRDADRSGEHSAVLYRRERFDLLRHDTFWLSQSPHIPGSKGWDAGYPRIVSWGELRDRSTGKTFFLFNTHLDDAGEVARREGTRLLLSRIDSIAGGAPVIVTGDFNAVPASEPYRLVTGAGFRDALTVSATPHRGPDSTWNGFREIEPGRRIDFVFVGRSVDVLAHAIIDERRRGRFPSDHLPAVAEVRLAGR